MDGPSVRNIKCLAFGINGVASPLVNGPHRTYGWPLLNLWMAPDEFMDGPSGANFKTFGAKTDQFYAISLHFAYFLGVCLLSGTIVNINE